MGSSLPWYRRHRDDAKQEKRRLSIEQQGALLRINDALLDEGEPLLDTPRTMAGLLGISVRRWRSLRDELIAHGFLKEVTHGKFQCISSEQFEAEQDRRVQDSKQHSDAARIRHGRGRLEKTSFNQMGGAYARKADAAAERDSRIRRSTASPPGKAVDPGEGQLSDLFSAMKDLTGRDYFDSYLRPARVKDGTLIARTGIAYDRIREHVRLMEFLDERDIKIAPPTT